MEAYLANILFFIVGLFFVILAIFIIRKKSLKIMADYDDKKNYCEKKLLKWTSNSFLISGLVIMLISVIAPYYNFINAAASFAVIVCLLAIAIGVGFSRYEVD